jgi:hypothetical protein
MERRPVRGCVRLRLHPAGKITEPATVVGQLAMIAAWRSSTATRAKRSGLLRQRPTSAEGCPQTPLKLPPEIGGNAGLGSAAFRVSGFRPQPHSRPERSACCKTDWNWGEKSGRSAPSKPTPEQFVGDSPLEGDGFELPVPRERRYRDLTFCASSMSRRTRSTAAPAKPRPSAASTIRRSKRSKSRPIRTWNARSRLAF